jgi:mannose-6-phosphate isomerase-like protein (cupin superfamily)
MSYPARPAEGKQGKQGEREREVVLGQALRATILTTASETDGRHDLTVATTVPGDQTPLHLHTRYEERFWVISGSLTVWAGPDKVTLTSGDYYAVPMNTPHAVQTGPDGARALLISSPAGFAELLARSGTPARLATPQTEFDADLFMAVTTELGDVILGPPGNYTGRAPASHRRGRPAADGRGRTGRRHFQRRNLQLPRAARRPDS